MNDDQFAYWLAGLVDGEGHLGVTLATSTTGRVAASPRFNITLTAADEAVLQFARDRAGVGSLRKLSRARERAAGRKSKDAVAWEVTGPSCATVAALLRGRMQSKKAKEAALWIEAVLASAAMPRYDSRRAPMLIKLRDDLRALRT